MAIETIRVILPVPQVVRINVELPVPIEVTIKAFTNVVPRPITPLGARPTTLNEVIAGGVTLGLWP